PPRKFERHSMNTDELTNQLKNCTDLDTFLTEYESEFNQNAFKEFLGNLLLESQSNKTKLAMEIGMSTSYISELFRGEKTAPGKDMLLRIAFGLGLPLDKANRLLILGGKAPLRSKLRRDAVIIYSIEKNLSLWQADELLYNYNMPTLSD
ncbi:MAG: helix-turn-helix domain-containing protein, partial [Turicibacter sp.]|nr:helix-turn-helix domain-containing protein [Turicibacter sp.]